MKNKWSGLLRVLIVFFMFILIINSFMLFKEIKRDVNFKNRSYGLSVMNDCFDNGEYYQIYLFTEINALVDETPYVDVSQYEAFGRFYNAYLKAKLYPNEDKYLKQMAEEKKNISWKKIINVVEMLEEELKEN